jgi:hypothetical protein
MTARHTLRRLYRRLTRSLRLAIIQWRMNRSIAELERLGDMREYLVRLHRNEASEQVCLAVRRQMIEREL